MASKAQQKDWLALFDDAQTYAPTGAQLKAWLFGGASIATKAAIFPLGDYKGRIVTDLFGEDGYFADSDQFWSAQNAAIAARREALIEAGWSDVEVMEPGQYFHSWEYEKTPKAKGGKVFITISHRGEVETHEGWLSAKEARKARAQAAKADGEADSETAKNARPEVTSSLQTYIDLHRHAAVRAVLTDHPGVALRLMIAHAVTGSPLWNLRTETQTCRNEAVAESVETSAAEARFDEKRRAVLVLLDFAPDEPTVIGGNGMDEDTSAIFARRLALPDGDVLAVLAVIMGETLEAGSAVVEAVGGYLGVDMASLWTPDDALLDLIRDRQVVNAVLRDIAGKHTADANVAEKIKTQKSIIRDHLTGSNDRRKVEGWVPKWLRFPAASYTARPFATLAKWKDVQRHMKGLPAPQPVEMEPVEPYAVAAE